MKSLRAKAIAFARDMGERNGEMAKYRVECIAADEFERGTLGEFGKPRIVFEGEWEDCMRFWSQQASGLHDGDYPCSNQDFSRARFWRVVAADEDGGSDGSSAHPGARVRVKTPERDERDPLEPQRVR